MASRGYVRWSLGGILLPTTVTEEQAQEMGAAPVVMIACADGIKVWWDGWVGGGGACGGAGHALHALRFSPGMTGQEALERARTDETWGMMLARLDWTTLETQFGPLAGQRLIFRREPSGIVPLRVSQGDDYTPLGLPALVEVAADLGLAIKTLGLLDEDGSRGFIGLALPAGESPEPMDWTMTLVDTCRGKARGVVSGVVPVCSNTVGAALAQGEQIHVIHREGAHACLARGAVDLALAHGAVIETGKLLRDATTLEATPARVDAYLSAMIGQEKGANRTKVTGYRGQVDAIFSEGGIGGHDRYSTIGGWRSVYALHQAGTQWATHDRPTKGARDLGLGKLDAWAAAQGLDDGSAKDWTMLAHAGLLAAMSV